MAKTAKRTRLSDDWKPSADDVAYADSKGVDVEDQSEAFRLHHGAHGNLMADWGLAWKLWCRNAVKFGKATGSPVAPLLSVVGDDPYGARAWSHTLRDGALDKRDGKAIWTIGGFDVVATAVEACEAAGLSPSSRPDLNPIAVWLRDGFDADQIIEAIRTAMKRPDRPVLSYYDRRVRELGRRAA